MKKQIVTVALALAASLVLLSVAGCNGATTPAPKDESPVVDPTVTVDGLAADWAALDQTKVASSTDLNNDDSGAPAQFTGIKAYSDGKFVYVLFSGTGIVATSFDTDDSASQVLIDADGSAATGYGAAWFWNGGSTANSVFGAELRVKGGYLHSDAATGDVWAPVALGDGFAQSTVVVSTDKTVMEMKIPVTGGLVGPRSVHLGAFVANGGAVQWHTLAYLPNNSIASGYLTLTIPAAQ